MKTLDVKLSGTYLDAASEIKEYEDLKGTIPFCDEGRAHQVCKSRYAVMWLNQQHKIRPKKMRQVYLDSCKESEKELTFIGKDIKVMSIEELQDLSVYLKIKVPIFKKSSLRNTRVKAVEKYLLDIKGVLEDKVSKIMELSFDDLPKCIINEKEELAEVESSLSDDLKQYGVEIADEETSEEYTLEDLKNLAKAKDIKFHPNIGYDKLRAKVFAE